ncbi:MAG: zinc ribbon domain-containing protein [Candidatus Hydrogenedentes bacterium]|nr:zinc ribbon domain-containing protein [Candidatus Hydrogenedentota bacterium]
MPLFNIVCQDCAVESEVLLRGKEVLTCPRCGSKQVERLLAKFAPMSSAPAAAPMGCGASQCCMMQGGCQN